MTNSELIREIEYRKRYLKNIVRKVDLKIWRPSVIPINSEPKFERIDGSDLASMLERTIELLDAAVEKLSTEVEQENKNA